MSYQLILQGPPSSQKNATLYQHARETMRFVSQAKAVLETFDNNDGIDLNSAKGNVVMASAQPANLRYNLAGALSQPNLAEIQGQIVDGKVEAILTGPSNSNCKVFFHETPTENVYTVESSPKGQCQYSPGTIKVSQDKNSAALRIEQQEEFPWQLTFDSSAVETEKRFPATGPTTQNDAIFYRRGERMQASIDKEMAELLSLDNGPQDLNPKRGVVVATAYKSQDSDNLIFDNMAGFYAIPTEAALHFDPLTGQVSHYARGFDSHESFSFRCQGENQVYERSVFGACDRLEVASDGSRFQQHFQEAQMRNVDSQLFQHERTINTNLVSRAFDSSNLVLSAAVGALAGIMTPGSVGVSIALGLLSAIATAGLINTAHQMGSADVPVGLNRFQGHDSQSRFANAQSAFDHIAMDRDLPHTSWDLSQQGPSREKCIEILNGPDAGPRAKIAILSQNLGENGDPAIAVLAKDLHYPIRVEDRGLVLPGGVTIPYASIRAIKEWTK